MSEHKMVTVEQIRRNVGDAPWDVMCRSLADHLLTLIEQSDEHGRRLDSHNCIMESIVRRVRALEQQARPEQEDGHLAGSWCDHGFRREDDPQWRAGMAQCAQCAAVPDWKAMYYTMADAHAEKKVRAETAERERDAFREQHETCDRDRDRLRSDAAIARASVERLRKFIWTLNHVKGCGWYLDASNCTCGLTAALEDA